MPREGDRFGNWIIERTLDKGGMGMVYLAYNPDLGKSEKVALKVLDPAVAERDADFVKRFYQEAAIVFKTHNEHLVTIHDAGRDAPSGFYYIVMEYLGGGTLRDRMRRQGPLPWREALAIIRPVAQALAAVAKRHSVHRDIKPENIMFTADGIVKLADFGIAKAAQEDSENMLKTMPEQVFGTPAYMSPEQVKDASAVDARADIWSLGVVLFEMLAGTRPYPSRSIIEVAAFLLSKKPFPDIRTFKLPTRNVLPETTAMTAMTQPLETQPTVATQNVCHVPDAVAELLQRMCNKDISKRIASSEAVIAEIDRLLQTDQASPQPTKEQHRKAFPVIGTMLGLLLIAALCAFVLTRPRQKHPAPVSPKPTAPAKPDMTAPVSPKPTTPAKPDMTAAISSKPAKGVLFQPQGGSIDSILSQLDAIITQRPPHLQISLSPYAQRKELSIERYETRLLVPAIERLRASGVSYSLVPGSGKYGAAVQDVSKRFCCDLD